MAIEKIRELQGGKGVYRIRFYHGRDETGKRIYLTETVEGKKEAEDRVDELKRLAKGGLSVAPSKMPFGKYLLWWLENVQKDALRERTFYEYRGVVERYVTGPRAPLPSVRRIRMDRLAHPALQGLYRTLQDSGLSAKTVRRLHAVIRQALAEAQRTGAAPRNAAALVKLPKVEKREVEAFTVAEAKRFLEAARGERYYALWALLLAGGLRPSEALGLAWEDVDLEAGRVRVQRVLSRVGVDGAPWKLLPPKTDKSRRTVPLPPFALQALKDHRRTQAEERLQLGAEYENNGFVFATPFGKPLDLANVNTRNFRGIMAAAGLGRWEGEGRGRRFLPAYRMYDLRHSCATHLLEAGENPKVVSERLGHCSVAFTMDVYAASLDTLQERAAERQEALYAHG